MAKFNFLSLKSDECKIQTLLSSVLQIGLEKSIFTRDY